MCCVLFVSLRVWVFVVLVLVVCCSVFGIGCRMVLLVVACVLCGVWCSLCGFRCLWFVICCVVSVVRGFVFSGCDSLFWCLLSVVGCSSLVVCRLMLFLVRRLLLVVGCWLVVGGCLLCVGCWLCLVVRRVLSIVWRVLIAA